MNEVQQRLTELLGPHCGLNAQWAEMAWLVYETRWTNKLGGVGYGWYIVDGGDEWGGEYNVIMRVTADEYYDTIISGCKGTVKAVEEMYQQVIAGLIENGIKTPEADA